MTQLLARTEKAVAAVERLYAKAHAEVARSVVKDRRISDALLEREQHRVHGLAWLATYLTTLRSLAAYCAYMADQKRLGELESLLVEAAFGEYLNHIAGGIPMNQAEFVRPADMGLSRNDLEPLNQNEIGTLMGHDAASGVRTRIIALMTERKEAATFGDCGLDGTLDQMRAEMRRFADTKVTPHAHKWHLRNDYVPLELIAELARLGVFSLTLP